MVWGKSYASKVFAMVVLFLVFVLIMALLTWFGWSSMVECNTYCDLGYWACRRDAWSCEARYPNYVMVNYAFVYFSAALTLLGIAAITRLLVLGTKYAEVSREGIRVVKGFIRKREILIRREEISEIRLQPVKHVWLYPLFMREWSVPIIISSGAATAAVKTGSEVRESLTLDAGDIVPFTKAVEEELRIKIETE